MQVPVQLLFCGVLYPEIIQDSMLYSHHNDTIIKTHEGKEDARRIKMHRRLLFKYIPLTLLQGFERLACERMLETEHKLHILTPLL